MAEQIVYTEVLTGYRFRNFLLFLLALFTAFILGESAGYSQCAIVPPVPPSNLLVATTISTTPTITQNVSQVSAGTALVTYCFSGGSLSADWFNQPWGTGGNVLLSGGLATVDGSLIGLNNLSSAGSSVEFVATFSGDPYQHVGFGIDLGGTPWAIFSTGSAGGSLYARTNDGTTTIDTPIQGTWLGSAHRYHIDWNTSNVVFSIDGNVVATHSISISGPMRPVVSDYVPGGGAVVVQSLQMASSSGSSVSPTPTFDFSVSNSGNQSVNAGSSVTNSISTTLVSGSTQSVSFSASGQPSGATTSFSAASCSPNCSSVLTINTSASTPAGSFPITVAATGSGVTRSTAFTFTVAVSTPIVTNPGTGKTYYVATNGRDSNPGTIELPFLTPQKCADVAVAGDTCLFRGGTYNSGHTHTMVLRTSGTSTSPITFKAYPGETAVLQAVNDGTLPNAAVIYFQAGNIIIDGLEIYGGYKGIVNPSSGDVMTNLNVHHQWGTGLELDGCGGCEVSYSIIHDTNQINFPRGSYAKYGGTWGSGIAAAGANAAIHHNYVYWNNGEGIVGGGASTSRATIDHNVVSDNWGAQIYTDGAAAGGSIKIDSNLIYITTTAATWSYGAANNNFTCGICWSSENSSHPTVTNVAITNNVVVHTNNGIYGFGNAVVMNWSNFTITNNTLVDNQTAINLQNTYSGTPGTTTNFSVQNNIITKQSVAQISAYPTPTQSTYNSNMFNTTGNSPCFYLQVSCRTYSDAVSILSMTNSSTANPALVDETAIPPRLWSDPSLPPPAPIAPLTTLVAPYTVNPGSPAANIGAQF